eukprot:TRINITY_DN1061_c0_g1_i10.p1 TRINITY_DN1061_c0_g1~~TRINITY_DN1061_c0_g1_i10.p1  ORF type:complete len:111 (+),score=15.71 TRINITY_DN1061_c0_g1_i10:407-739(+)
MNNARTSWGKRGNNTACALKRNGYQITCCGSCKSVPFQGILMVEKKLLQLPWNAFDLSGRSSKQVQNAQMNFQFQIQQKNWNEHWKFLLKQAWDVRATASVTNGHQLWTP